MLVKKKVFIVDDFYDDPIGVRNFALSQDFVEDLNYHKGKRTREQHDFPGLRQAFETILGFEITKWTETYPASSRFQYCTAEDKLVYHCDTQQWAGVLYLTPNAPYSAGTSLFSHTQSGLRNQNDFNGHDVFGDIGYYDKSKFDLVDVVGNVFNRLVLFDAKSIHAASEYFGTTKENGRLFQVFFFD